MFTGARQEERLRQNSLGIQFFDHLHSTLHSIQLHDKGIWPRSGVGRGAAGWSIEANKWPFLDVCAAAAAASATSSGSLARCQTNFDCSSGRFSKAFFPSLSLSLSLSLFWSGTVDHYLAHYSNVLLRNTLVGFALLYAIKQSSMNEIRGIQLVPC